MSDVAPPIPLRPGLRDTFTAMSGRAVSPIGLRRLFGGAAGGAAWGSAFAYADVTLNRDGQAGADTIISSTAITAGISYGMYVGGAAGPLGSAAGAIVGGAIGFGVGWLAERTLVDEWLGAHLTNAAYNGMGFENFIGPESVREITEQAEEVLAQGVPETAADYERFVRVGRALEREGMNLERGRASLLQARQSFLVEMAKDEALIHPDVFERYWQVTILSESEWEDLSAEERLEYGLAERRTVDRDIWESLPPDQQRLFSAEGPNGERTAILTYQFIASENEVQGHDAYFLNERLITQNAELQGTVVRLRDGLTQLDAQVDIDPAQTQHRWQYYGPGNNLTDWTAEVDRIEQSLIDNMRTEQGLLGSRRVPLTEADRQRYEQALHRVHNEAEDRLHNLRREEALGTLSRDERIELESGRLERLIERTGISGGQEGGPPASAGLRATRGFWGAYNEAFVEAYNGAAVASGQPQLAPAP
ncbi:MAG: hypothetical protein GC136_02365 [Alphaproteobacteria bacterium]|nr:hypothetical protein [Alphaproteobacteria bacterium]